ncbi:MAG: argininosuccinate lyase [Elusimicrobia bacterium]|nr:argininosuccinate lyase [Elusimicrobiota bacterium]
MKLWGGRFRRGPTDKFVSFESSLSFDFRLAPFDIAVNRAWAKMLAKIEIISDSELKKILAGLDDVENDFEKGRIGRDDKFEDIHTLIEDRLFTYAGVAARKLPAGRSRNELISTDVRLYLRDRIDYIIGQIRGFQRRLVARATENSKVVFPAFTHLQPAVPVTLGHFILNYFWKFERDKRFLKFAKDEVNVMPLGAGAAGGTTLPIDREFLMRELLFSKVFENSVDATSSRDFILVFLEACVNMGIHLSGICEDVVIFSTPHFGYIRIPDEYSTGSSLMPQKKNPDFFELVRGKTGKIMGNLIALMAALKGLPSGYNRDLQEDKVSLFDAIDEITEILEIFPSVFSSLEFDEARISKSIEDGTICAQAVAEYLVQKGVPFREAHGIVGRIIADCEAAGTKLRDLKIDALKMYSNRFAADVFPLLDPAGVIKQLAVSGSPAPLRFEQQLRMAYEQSEG